MAEADGHNSESIALSLQVTPGANNAAGNYTPITWVLIAADSNGESWSGSAVTGTVNINGNVIGYSYDWSTPGTGNRTLASGTANIAHASNGTKTLPFSFTFNGIPGTSQDGASGSSSTTLTPIPPQAPTGLAAGTLTTPGSVPLSWAKAAGSTPTTYDLQLSYTSDFAGHTTKSITGTSYTWTGLPPSQSCYFRVRGVNAAGDGAWSPAINVTTLAGGKVSRDGETFVATTTKKRWNGSSWVTITIGKRWDGTKWVNLT